MVTEDDHTLNPDPFTDGPLEEPLRPVSPTWSLAPTAVTGVTHWTAMPPTPDPNQIRNVLGSMKQTLEGLGVVFNDFTKHAGQVASLGDNFDATSQLSSLQKHLDLADEKNERKMNDIKTSLRGTISAEVVPHVRGVISDDVDEQLDLLIDQMVAEEIQQQLPPHVREQIQQDKEQLEEVYIALQNSEARRANATLRSTHLKDPLRPLLKPTGEISANFPRDLTALFELDAKQAKALNLEYELNDVGDNREKNLNRFMQFCGVAYQMVPTAALT